MMPIQPDFIAFHQSLTDELNANKDQVRNLIGDAHWLSDGEHKEAILRRVLQNKLPDTFRVGTGFFSDTFEPSSQIDILITDANKPTLFRNGDFLVVTPDCVKAIIEVKTELNGPVRISKALMNLVNNVERIRYHNPDCWAGLFVYEGPQNNNQQIMGRNSTNSNNLLKTLMRLAQNNARRAINCITIGGNNFIRFWQCIPQDFSSGLQHPGWQYYVFDNNRHHGLSPAYFVGNLVMHLTDPEESDIRRAWFPIQDGHGKEDYRHDFIEMNQQRSNANRPNP